MTDTKQDTNEKLSMPVLLGRAVVAYVHSPCTDGETAAVLLHRHYPKLEIRPFTHGETKIIPDKLEHHTLFVDCCPPELDKFANKRITVIDHHASTMLQLKRLGWTADFETGLVTTTSGRAGEELRIHLDVTTCASMMLFRMLMGREKEPPRWMKVVNLWDLGQFDRLTDDDKALHLALSKHTGNWRALAKATEEDAEQDWIEEGRKSMLEKQQKITSWLDSGKNVTFAPLLDNKYMCAYLETTAPDQWQLISDLPSALKETLAEHKADVVAVRSLTHGKDGNITGTRFSLRRALGSTVELHLIAQKCNPKGGGGHPGAAAVQFDGDVQLLDFAATTATA